MAARLLLSLTLLLSLQGDGVPADKVLGKAMFRVVKSTDNGEHATFEPLMVPYFQVDRTGGEGNLGETIVSCDVVRSVAGTDEGKGIVFISTVLRCKGQEFHLAEVDFTMSDK